MSRVLLAGYGALGAALGAKLCADGHAVFGLRRNASLICAPVTPIAGDLSEVDSLGDVPLDVDSVVYTATPGAFDDDAYARAYVQGPRNLFSLWKDRATRPERFIFVSSTSVYGQASGERVDENSTTAPTGFSGRRLLEGERVVRDSGFNACIVRFGGIYGPGRTRLIDRVKSGATCQDEPDLYTNRIHQDDCVGVLHHLVVRDEVASVYVAVDDHPAPQCEVMDWLAARLNAPRPERIPASQSARRGPGSKRCSNALLRSSGYRFIYPSYREGYAAMLAT